MFDRGRLRTADVRRIRWAPQPCWQLMTRADMLCEDESCVGVDSGFRFPYDASADLAGRGLVLCAKSDSGSFVGAAPHLRA